MQKDINIICDPINSLSDFICHGFFIYHDAMQTRMQSSCFHLLSACLVKLCSVYCYDAVCSVFAVASDKAELNTFIQLLYGYLHSTTAIIRCCPKLHIAEVPTRTLCPQAVSVYRLLLHTAHLQMCLKIKSTISGSSTVWHMLPDSLPCRMILSQVSAVTAQSTHATVFTPSC